MVTRKRKISERAKAVWTQGYPWAETVGSVVLLATVAAIYLVYYRGPLP